MSDLLKTPDQALKSLIDNSTQTQNAALANELAKTLGYDTIQELIKDVGNKVSSTNAAERRMGEKLGAETITELALLVLKQEIVSQAKPSYLNFANIFDDGILDAGNSKQYLFNMPTGNSKYDPDQFIPINRTEQFLKQHIISIYDRNNIGEITLNPNTVQYRKNLTISEVNWLQYFKTGTLNQFLTELRSNLRMSFEMFKYDKIANYITSLQDIKTVQGTAKNMFDCFVDEIFPLLTNFDYYSSDYNRDQNFKGIVAAGASNMYMIMSANNLARFKTGIKSQVYNAQFLNFKNIMDDSRIFSLGKKFNISNENTPIVMKEETYIDDNTIYIFDKNIIKLLYQIDKQQSQSFAENLATQIVLHIWLTYDTLPWGQIVKYTNKNLKVLPGNEAA